MLFDITVPELLFNTVLPVQSNSATQCPQKVLNIKNDLVQLTDIVQTMLPCL